MQIFSFDSYCKANNEDDGERRKVAMFLFWLDFIDVVRTYHMMCLLIFFKVQLIFFSRQNIKKTIFKNQFYTITLKLLECNSYL